jgi:O-antigen ligase
MRARLASASSAAIGEYRPLGDRLPEPATLAGAACLLLVLVLQGAALTQSYLWAAPLAALLLVAVAADIPLVPLIGVALLARVFTDDLASSASRSSGALNPSAGIAALLILVAAGLILRRRRGIWTVGAICLAIAIWTGTAVLAEGASTLTVREGVRELSIVALAVIVFNSRGVLSVKRVGRIVQIAGTIAALLALQQLATHSGDNIGGAIRAHGTFVHPNAAAVYFAIAAVVSLWLYLEQGRNRLDLGFLCLFTAACISTFSLDGFATLLVMVATLGLLRSGSQRLRFGILALVPLLLVIFLATPLGSERLASESTSEIGSVHKRGTADNSSLAWRFAKWESLIPEWERNPIVGRGLGTIVSEQEPTVGGTGSVLPHNEYVRYLVETGILGIAFILIGLRALIRRLRRGRRWGPTRNVAALGIAVLVGLMINGLAANTLLYTPPAYAAAMILAAVLAAISAAPADRGRGRLA